MHLLDGSATEPVKTVTDPAQADSANAAALKEYDFVGAAIATYKREGETLTIRALRFNDASGAYGAYTFYRQNGWPKEEIGTGATSDHTIACSSGRATRSWTQRSPTSAPCLPGNCANWPTSCPSRMETGPSARPFLPSCPRTRLTSRPRTMRWGRQAMPGQGGVLPPELVGFDRDAETVTANYSLRSGPATLTIIEYPTPQMAAAHGAKIRDYIKAGSQAQPPWPKPLQDSDQASLEVRRSGLLVAARQRRRHSRGKPQAPRDGSL